MKIKILWAALLLATSPAWAINKCTGPDGKVTYQEAVCEGGKKINISGAGQADPSSNVSNYWRREIARQTRNEKVESAISEGRVFIGMEADDARRSWGNPTKINTSIGSYGKHEQWVYERRNSRSQYVYIENGVVTSTQSPE